MSLVAEAVKHLRATGNLEEAVEIALGQKSIEEAGVPATPQVQTWFCPNENAVNQLVLWVQNKLGIRVGSIEDHDNGAGGAPGYAVTFAGDMMPGDIASLASRYGCVPLEGASPAAAL
jgi:hypothetical protein